MVLNKIQILWMISIVYQQGMNIFKKIECILNRLSLMNHFRKLI